MDIIVTLKDKSLKSTEKRKLIISGITDGTITKDAIEVASNSLDEKQIAIIMEAMEEITRAEASCDGDYFLSFAKRYVSAGNNSLRREASRVVGNLAAKYPHQVAEAIGPLLAGAKDESTIIRWSSAYALSRIVCIPQYAADSLYDKVTKLSESEDDSGVKNQYQNGLKKAKKARI